MTQFLLPRGALWLDQSCLTRVHVEFEPRRVVSRAFSMSVFPQKACNVDDNTDPIIMGRLFGTIAQMTCTSAR